MRRAVWLSFLCGCASQPNQPMADSQPVSGDGCDNVAAFVAKHQTEAEAKLLSGWTPTTKATDATKPALSRLSAAYLEACGTEQTIQLTADLVKFPTVRTDEPPAKTKAFVDMAAYLKAWGAKKNMSWDDNGDHEAWTLARGEGKPKLRYVMHADVVPSTTDPNPKAGLPEGWTYPPFELTRVEDRIYGRGTEDDKGPIAAVLVVMDILRQFGLEPAARVEAVMGTGEEHGWDGFIAYAKTATPADHTISLDASFPVVIAESGFVRVVLEAPTASKKGPTKGCLQINNARAGEFLTQVPGEAWMQGRFLGRVLKDIPEGKANAKKFTSDGDPTSGYVHRDKEQVTFRWTGQAVHSSVSPQGHNALWALAKQSKLPDGSRFALCPGGTADLLGVVRKYFADDHWGVALGMAHEHDIMGKLLVIPTLLRVEDGKARLSVNMRRPAGLTKEEFEARLAAAIKNVQAKYPAVTEVKDRRYVGNPALVDPEATTADSLLAVYREVSGDRTAKAVSIRGGTYARLFPGAVSFGPSLPGKHYAGHAPDEFMEVEALRFMLKSVYRATITLGSD